MSELSPSAWVVLDVELRPGSSDVVVFTPSRDLDRDGLRDALRAYLDRRVPPDRVILLASEAAADSLASAARDGWIRDALEGITGSFDDDQVLPIAFNERGDLRDLSGRGSDLVDHDTAALMMRCGLRAIFDRNDGLLRAGPGYHFVNPSGVHTTAFIRAGDVLRHSAEIGFVALQLLRLWPARLRHIYVDTAAISSVAYALVELRRMFDPDLVAPTIDSFSSYGGVASFDFRPGGLCLLSASISGGLEDLIHGTGVDLAGIATLFYGGPLLSGRSRHIVCDLVARPPTQEGIEEIQCYRESDCTLCAENQGVVRLSGDQFLPATPHVDGIMVRREDAPSWLPNVLKALVGRGATRCHFSTPTATRDLHLQLDANGAIAPGTPLAERFERQLDAALPATVTTILHSDDEPSRQLAMRVATRYREATGDTLGEGAVLSESKAARLEGPVDKSTSTVVVVTAVAATGRALLRISQILRREDGVGVIVYLVCVSRLLDAGQRRRVESSLCQADWPGRFRVVTGTHAFLPRRPSPWEVERRLLESLARELDESDPEAAASAQERTNRLSSGEALVDELFLPSVRGGALDPAGSGGLRVGTGFVFWRQIDDRPYAAHTQADVYLTISAVLHALRSKQEGRPPLIQHEHNRTVLDPGNFRRYTDGAIQAAFLRATEPRELHYDAHPQFSAEMFDVVAGMLRQPEHESSAALAEFLLAIALGHMRLEIRHLQRLATELESEARPPLLRALAARISAHAA